MGFRDAHGLHDFIHFVLIFNERDNPHATSTLRALKRIYFVNKPNTFRPGQRRPFPRLNYFGDGNVLCGCRLKPLLFLSLPPTAARVVPKKSAQRLSSIRNMEC